MFEWLAKLLRAIGILPKKKDALAMSQEMRPPAPPWARLLQSEGEELRAEGEKKELTAKDKDLLKRSGFMDIGVNEDARNESLNSVHQHVQLFPDVEDAEHVCSVLGKRGFLAKLDDSRDDGRIAVIVESEHPVASAVVAPDATPSAEVGRDEVRSR